MPGLAAASPVAVWTIDSREEVSNLQPVAPVRTVERLEQMHGRLDSHFRALYEMRAAGGAPVFALEHGLTDADRRELVTVVQAAVAQGFGLQFRKWWLPFVVYAAESGYGYAGDEYWQSFAEQTPMWARFGDRDKIRDWFRRFADSYGGVVPRGAFARTFPIIAWPITHAVLPTYLQRNLAQLLFEFRTGLTTDLLGDPEALGVRLASRASAYTERFRIFCENTSLLGHVAVALLSGDEEDSPFLLRSTLQRLVAALSREQQSKHWLTSARQSASRVRSRGFVSAPPKPASILGPIKRLPQPTDPRLLLRHQDGAWRVSVVLPDLSLLSARLPHAFEELRNRRTHVEGAEGAPLARGRLLFAGQEVRLAKWPRDDVAFLRLDGGSEAVNRLIADQCVTTPGPVWLFRRSPSAPAAEVKSRVIRPGSSYVLALSGAVSPPWSSWSVEASSAMDGIRIFELTVPKVVSQGDIAAFAAIGIATISDITIRPVGLVASSWDGEGSVEWLAGEPGMLAIQSELAPETCMVSLDSQHYSIAWPSPDRELFLMLDDLAVGTHEVGIMLLGGGARRIASETLLVTIRDPQVRPETATAGEGIRLLASPARPTLSDLWDGCASLSIEGPPSTPAELIVTLVSESREVLAEIRRGIELPMPPDEWPRVAERIRREQKFQHTYDAAESVEIAVRRAGVGFAALTCDRGFRPLRWRVLRQHNGSFRARLIDRTDGSTTNVELFSVDAPDVPVACQVGTDIVVPAHGGLLRATAGEMQASLLLPTQPNEVLRAGTRRSTAREVSRRPQDLARLIALSSWWSRAELPADAFAQSQQQRALDAITRAIVSSVTGSRWSTLEQRLATASDLIDFIDDMKSGVGQDSRQVALAKTIATSLWAWLTPADLLTGFADAIVPDLRVAGLAGRPAAPHFLLLLAGRPGDLARWQPSELIELLDAVIKSPVLLRAARFAVLGTRAFNEAAEAAKGF